MISISKILHLSPLDPFRRKFDTPTLSKITLVARARKSPINSARKKYPPLIHVLRKRSMHHCRRNKEVNLMKLADTFKLVVCNLFKFLMTSLSTLKARQNP